MREKTWVYPYYVNFVEKRTKEKITVGCDNYDEAADISTAASSSYSFSSVTIVKNRPTMKNRKMITVGQFVNFDF